MIRETENDDLTGVMQKLISTYGDQEQVASIAIDIARDLVSQFRVSLPEENFGRDEFCDEIILLFTQAGTFVQLLDGDDSDEKAVTAMGILNTLETMLNVMEGSKEVFKCLVVEIGWFVLASC